MVRRSLNSCGLLVLTSLLTSAATARAQHGDINLFDDGGRVGVGLIDGETEVTTPGVRVFEAILVPDSLPFSPFDVSASDPGFDVLDGQLPADAAVSFSLLSLRVWNGVDFAPAPGVHFEFFLPDGLTTDDEGGLHTHVLFGLTDLTLDPLPLADGVYAAAVSVQAAGLAPSEPLHLVMLKDELIAGEEEARELEELLEAFEDGGPEPIFSGKNFAFFEEAVEALESRVPEPSGAALGAVAAGLVGRRRRRADD